MPAPYLYRDGAESLVVSYDLGAGVVNVTAGDGPKFGDPTADRPLRIIVGPAGSRYGSGQFLATGRVGDQLTGVAVEAGKSGVISRNNRIDGSSWTAADADAVWDKLDDLQEQIDAGGGGGGGSGTVTTISIASANGFAGSSNGSAANPQLTIRTSVTGLLKGDGTGVSPAVAGADYVSPSGLSSALTPYATTAALTSGLATKQDAIATGTAAQYLKGNLSLGTFAADVAANLPTTGLTLNQYKSVPTTPAPTSGGITLGAAAATNYELSLTGDATITLGGGGSGARLYATVWPNGHALAFGGSGADAIAWRGGAAPVGGTDYDASKPVDLIFTWKTATGSWLGDYAAAYLGGSGGVTSVAVTMPSGLFDATGSPITSSGTIAFTLKAQAKNKFLAGPVSGADAAPTMRVIDPADVPTTGLTINAWTSDVGEADGSDNSGAPVLDVAAHATHVVTLDANSSPTFSGAAAGRRVTIYIVQDETGSRTWTWPGGLAITWITAGGAAPAIASGATKTSVVLLHFTSPTAAYGYWLGSNA